MSLVVLENIGLAFGARDLIDGLDLRLGDHDRVGLVGPNGSGKSTLLRILAAVMTPDRGQVRRRKGLRIGYLPQDIDLQGGISLRRFVIESVPGMTMLEAEVEEAERELAQAERAADEAALMNAAERIAAAHERLAHFSEHFSEHEAARILDGLGFVNAWLDRDLSEFSGGWRMRAMLAALLFQRPDLLLLDEPTNHLDLPSVAWFGAFLQRYEHAFVLICHDREFLNEQVGRVVSFEPEGVRQYDGNYEQYKTQRAEELLVLSARARNLQREREHNERFVERFRFKASKAKAVQSRVKALERMDTVELVEERRTMQFMFPPCARAGNEVVKVRGLAKRYGELEVFSHVDFVVRRGERVGIIGPNGAGKTTLLKVLANELQAEQGQVELGHNVTLAYYAQHHGEALNPNRTVLEEVTLRDPAANPTRIRGVLGAFLFGEDAIDKPIRVLSGGERARVALACMLVAPGNLILMDEPTNHLDLDSSESLAEALMGFQGTLMFVSHNRSFVRRLATRIFDVHDGMVEAYPGTLDEYMDRFRAVPRDAARNDEGKRGAAQSRAPDRASAPMVDPAGSKRDRAAERERKRIEAEKRALRSKKVGPLKQRVEALEREIEAVERRQREQGVKLADPEVFADDAVRARLLEEYRVDAERLQELTATWELACAEAEAIESELGISD